MARRTRSDSLDPATTCAGLTSKGEHCRRALASSTETYCWQHKDQAPSTQSKPSHSHGHGQSHCHSHGSNHAKHTNGRSSIDTIMERLNINDPSAPPKKPRSKKRQLLCCCFELLGGQDPSSSTPPARPVKPRPTASSASAKPPTGLGPGAGDLSWIPSTLSSEATANLLAELDKPISEADEPGYIYMFWVTPIDSRRSAPPPADIGSSLFPEASLPNIRSIGDAIRAAREYNALVSSPTGKTAASVRLKIGRTNNVHRRINEWTKQCSHDLTLLRYYPYTHSSPDAPPWAGEGVTAPYIHRVERLIHLELGDIRIRDMGPCPDCGKEHQEWFEVPAEKEALEWVDGSIRRWCKWAAVHQKKHGR